MKLTVAVLGLLLAGGTPMPIAAADAPTIVMPSQLNWMSDSRLPPGAKMAVVYGDPKASGGATYIVRLMLPDGAIFPPHFHDSPEYVTVLQGTLLVGLGDTVDKTKMTALGAGSFVGVPAGVHHYAMAQGATIIQVGGPGPMTLTPVGGTH